MTALFTLTFGPACHKLDTHNFGIERFTTDDDKRYYRDLSKLVSGRASRNLLAFFVPDNSAASQADSIQSSIVSPAHLWSMSGQIIISIANHVLTDYDGLTLQNYTAFGRIWGAVAVKTDGKTRHPRHLPYSG